MYVLVDITFEIHITLSMPGDLSFGRERCPMKDISMNGLYTGGEFGSLRPRALQAPTPPSISPGREREVRLLLVR